MLSILLLIHTILCLTLIGLVLVQQGKGADMGAAFGGGSNTVFGAGGAADFITRLTTGMAIAFMVSSIFLVKAYSSAARSAPVLQSAPVNPLAGSVMENAAAPVVAEPAAVPESGTGSILTDTVITDAVEEVPAQDVSAKNAAVQNAEGDPVPQAVIDTAEPIAPVAGNQ